jgi:hypothetical protein
MTLRHRFAATGLAAALALAPVAAVASSFVAAPAAQAAPAAPLAASRAGVWLGSQLTDGQYYKSPYTGQADIGNTANVLIGLVAGGNQISAAKVNGWLKQNVSKATSAGQIATIAIAAKAVGEDPAKYGGRDLISEITSAVQKGNGSLGDPYSDALAIIALKGSSDSVPDDLVGALVKQQNKEGEFFFSSDDGDFADPDTTGLAIQALDGVDGDDAGAALSKAVGWAVKNQASAGYWESYSPVNTTGLVASALAEQGKDVSKATTWMAGQQLKNGGLPNTLNGKDGDAYATAQGLLLLGGVTLNSVQQQGIPLPTVTKPSLPTPSLPTLPSLPSATLPTLPPLPSATSTTSGSTPAPTALPATGAEGDSSTPAGDLGALVFGVVAVGAIGGGAALRIRRHS